jgi:hypothetical protein
MNIEKAYETKTAIKLEDIICPLSNKIPKNPVKANDGHIYEKSELDLFVNLTGNMGRYTPRIKSPINSSILLDERKFISNNLYNIMIDLYVKNNNLEKRVHSGNNVFSSLINNDKDYYSKHKNFSIIPIMKSSYVYSTSSLFVDDAMIHIIKYCSKESFSYMRENVKWTFYQLALWYRNNSELHKQIILRLIAEKHDFNQKTVNSMQGTTFQLILMRCSGENITLALNHVLSNNIIDWSQQIYDGKDYLAIILRNRNVTIEHNAIQSIKRIIKIYKSYLHPPKNYLSFLKYKNNNYKREIQPELEGYYLEANAPLK